jgi:hypothetical protein
MHVIYLRAPRFLSQCYGLRVMFRGSESNISSCKSDYTQYWTVRKTAATKGVLKLVVLEVGSI